MKYEIFGDSLPAVTIQLNEGESVYTQSGGLAWMSSDVTMTTEIGTGAGGKLKGLLRSVVTGESLFKATYTAESDGQSFTASSSFPGSIIALDVSNGPYVAQRNAFLCAELSVDFGIYTVPGLGAALFGGEGVFLQEFSGEGLAFLEIDGYAKEITLGKGEVMKVSTGNVAAFEHTVEMNIEVVKGLKNILFAGEGILLTTLRGPGKIWLQTLDTLSLARKITPFLPDRSSSS